MDLTVAAFDDPSRFRPTSHFGAESIHRGWLDTSGLQRMRSDDIEAGRSLGDAAAGAR